MSGMFNNSDPGEPTRAAASGISADDGQGRRRKRRRRGRRIALVSIGSLLAVLAVAVIGGYAFANHLGDRVQRIHVAHLTAASGRVGGPAGQDMNVLITGQDRVSGVNHPSGLIMILHIDASQQAAGAVSIHPFVPVAVPGHGRTKIQNALVFGGPSLLVQTVAQLTGVSIQHYARIDFPHVASLIRTMGGVDIPTPSGTEHLGGAAALRYARDPALDEEGRVLRQQALIRAVMRKIAQDHLLTNLGVLNGLTSMLTVDSDFTNSQLLDLARQLENLSGSAGTFVRAPHFTVGGEVFLAPAASHQLWAAVRQDALAAWARAHPRWVTLEVVP